MWLVERNREKWQAFSLITVVTPLLLTMGATAKAREINCLHCQKNNIKKNRKGDICSVQSEAGIINLWYSWAFGQEKRIPVEGFSSISLPVRMEVKDDGRILSNWERE
jgi:hypothetical protein